MYSKYRRNSTSSVHSAFTIHSHDWGEKGLMIRRSIAAMIYAHMEIVDDNEVAHDEITNLPNFNISIRFDNDDFVGTCDIPHIEMILRFMCIIYENVQYSAKCDIYALIYLNKLVAKRAAIITPTNYQAFWIVCVLLANTFWGHDLQKRPRFGEIFYCFSSCILATLEQQVLTMLQNSVQVSRSLFAKYYFELSTYIFTITIENNINDSEYRVALTNLRAIFLNLRVFENSAIDKEYLLRKLNSFRIKDDIPVIDNKSFFVIRICG